MNHQFDELVKAMAQSVTRRAALKRFGVGMGLFALAALGLSSKQKQRRAATARIRPLFLAAESFA